MADLRSPAERRLAAQIANQVRWSRTTDRTGATAAARRAMDKKFEDEVDPDRVLSAAERGKRVENARKAHYSRLALASAKARRLKR